MLGMMADSKLVDDLKKCLKCPICWGELDDARVLACGHVFCLTCIEKDFDRRDKVRSRFKGACPLCKRAYFPRERNANNLSKDVVVNDVLERLKDAGRIACVFCSEDDATRVCLKCKLNMCKYCSLRSKIKCAHECITKDDLDTNPFLRDIIERSRAKQTCSKHPEEDVDYFCKSCNHVHCNSCRLQRHLHHDVQGLQDAARECRRIITVLLMTGTREYGDQLDALLRDVVDGSTVQKSSSRRHECGSFHKKICYVDQFASDKVLLEVLGEHQKQIQDVLTLCERKPQWGIQSSDCGGFEDYSGVSKIGKGGFQTQNLSKNISRRQRKPPETPPGYAADQLACWDREYVHLNNAYKKTRCSLIYFVLTCIVFGCTLGHTDELLIQILHCLLHGTNIMVCDSMSTLDSLLFQDKTPLVLNLTLAGACNMMKCFYYLLLTIEMILITIVRDTYTCTSIKEN